MRLSIRNVLRGAWASLVAVVSLAFDIAANATIFSLVQALEFPDLPYPDASRIVLLESRNHPRGVQGR